MCVRTIDFRPTIQHWRLSGVLMGIRLKFNLVLLAVSALGVALFALIAGPFLKASAREEVIVRSRIMMESAAGMRKYTVRGDRAAADLKPRTDKFHPQTDFILRSHQEFRRAAEVRSRTTTIARRRSIRPTRTNRAIELGSQTSSRISGPIRPRPSCSPSAIRTPAGSSTCRARSLRAGVPDLPRHARYRPAGDARQIRSPERLRLEAERNHWRRRSSPCRWRCRWRMPPRITLTVVGLSGRRIRPADVAHQSAVSAC